MNYWDIYKDNSHDDYCTTVQADNERDALKTYRNGLMSSGFYSIVKHSDGTLRLETTFGACYAAYRSTRMQTV